MYLWCNPAGPAGICISWRWLDFQLSVFHTGVQSGPVPGSGALPGDCTTHAALNDSGRKLVELGGFTIAL